MDVMDTQMDTHATEGPTMNTTTVGKIAEYAARVVAQAPPLTVEQRVLIRDLLRPDAAGRPLRPTEAEIERQRAEAEKRREHERRAAFVRKAASYVAACAVCGIPEVAHLVQKGYGMGFHDWQPRTAAEIASVIGAMTASEQVSA